MNNRNREKKNDTTRIFYTYIVYSPTSSVRTPTSRVVTTRRGTCRRRGHSTARISPILILVGYTCRSHACHATQSIAAASRLNSRPAVRLRISRTAHEANHSPPPLLPPPPLSRRPSESGGCTSGFIPTAGAGRAVHPASTCRDATRTRGG